MIKNNKGVIVKSGDIFRLGRVIYKVIESSLDKKKEIIKSYQEKTQERNNEELMEMSKSFLQNIY